jgi:hypothetical protein
MVSDGFSEANLQLPCCISELNTSLTNVKMSDFATHDDNEKSYTVAS